MDAGDVWDKCSVAGGGGLRDMVSISSTDGQDHIEQYGDLMPVVISGGGGTSVGTIPDGSITTAKLADGAVTFDKAGFFQKRQRVTQAAVAGVAEAAAAVTYDLSGQSAVPARATLTAKVAGVAGNQLRFRLKVATGGEIANTMVAEADTVSYTVLLNGGSLSTYTLGNIGLIINNFGNSAPFTFASVDHLSTALLTPHIEYVALTGGADEVTAQDEITEEVEPAVGQSIEFAANGKMQNSELGLGVSYGAPQSFNVSFTAFLRYVGTGINLDITKKYVFNVGANGPGDVQSGLWEIFNMQAWIGLTMSTASSSASNSSSTFYPFNESVQIFFGRGANNEILIASTDDNIELYPFSIKEVIS